MFSSLRLSFAALPNLVFALQNLRFADPQIAREIYAGRFTFVGQSLDTHGQSPFLLPARSKRWKNELLGFSWLRHLQAYPSPLTRENARALVGDWIYLSQSSQQKMAWDISVTARRLLSFLTYSSLILEGAHASFQTLFMRSLRQHAAFLGRWCPFYPEEEGRLEAYISITALGLCADNAGLFLKLGTKGLLQELKRSFLPDGNPISRNPTRLIEGLLDLFALHHAWQARNLPTPPEILIVLERMVFMAQLLRQCDGRLANFNGTTIEASSLLDVLLSYEAQPLILPPNSFNRTLTTYQRIETEHCFIIMDAGTTPPKPWRKGIHAGYLSFELSTPKHRLIVNCGIDSYMHTEWEEVLKSTAAHSALIINDTSSGPVSLYPPSKHKWYKGGSRRRKDSTHVHVERAFHAQVTELSATHDGYVRRFNCIHQRQLRLYAKKPLLEGEDHVFPAKNTQRFSHASSLTFTVRFHLHPHIRKVKKIDNYTVLLEISEGEMWVFESGEAPCQIEESIFVGLIPQSATFVSGLDLQNATAVDGGSDAISAYSSDEKKVVNASLPQRDLPKLHQTQQIVLMGDVAQMPTISWRFFRRALHK